MEQKDTEVMFPNFPQIRKLKLQIFQVTTLLHSFLFCNPTFASLAIFSFKI